MQAVALTPTLPTAEMRIFEIFGILVKAHAFPKQQRKPKASQTEPCKTPDLISEDTNKNKDFKFCCLLLHGHEPFQQQAKRFEIVVAFGFLLSKTIMRVERFRMNCLMFLLNCLTKNTRVVQSIEDMEAHCLLLRGPELVQQQAGSFEISGFGVSL
jgi:hypothetical protein